MKTSGFYFFLHDHAAERSHPMFQFLITEEERTLLMDLLECDISELHSEIVDTDRREYREMLKNRERLMKKLQRQLTQDVQEIGTP